MAKVFQILLILCLIFPSIIHADTNTESLKLAFIKEGYLWIKSGEETEKITDKKATYNYPPQWSFDGKMLLYQKETQVFIILP